MVSSGLMLSLSSRAVHNTLSIYSDTILLLIWQNIWLQSTIWKVKN